MPQHLVAVFAWNLGATAVVGIQAKLLRPKDGLKALSGRGSGKNDSFKQWTRAKEKEYENLKEWERAEWINRYRDEWKRRKGRTGGR